MHQPTLNAFMSLGKPAWSEARSTLQRILSKNEVYTIRARPCRLWILPLLAISCCSYYDIVCTYVHDGDMRIRLCAREFIPTCAGSSSRQWWPQGKVVVLCILCGMCECVYVQSICFVITRITLLFLVWHCMCRLLGFVYNVCVWWSPDGLVAELSYLRRK